MVAINYVNYAVDIMKNVVILFVRVLLLFFVISNFIRNHQFFIFFNQIHIII